jgi:hypothetical protein
MRILAFLVVLVSAAHADTVWNVKINGVELHTLETDPNVLFPSCRCVAGVWHKKSESATQLTGTLDAPSFNHARKAGKSLGVKLRKTRNVMGVHRDYREELHGILNGSGQLVLREVSGGEWEVVGFAAGKIGDLFKTHASWRAEKAKVAKPSPLVDNASDSTELAKIINDYRASIKLPRVPLSKAMTKVAQAHVHDLAVNKPVGGACNMHSWSKHGSWSSCCYDGSKEAARCMWKKPKEIAGYKSPGYEIAANASGITPEKALELWQKSPAHHAVMINKDQWNKPWRAMGVAVEGDYAVAWFGEDAD